MAITRRVFYSFHYKPDSWRVSKIRNIGAIAENKPVHDNDWETIKGNEAKIERWIQDQLYGRSCTVVLIGGNTAGRKWINYEIKESWKKGMGVLGVHIHNLTDHTGNFCSRGANPFSGLVVNGVSLGSVVVAHDPWVFLGSSADYRNHIAANLDGYIEQAITIRRQH